MTNTKDWFATWFDSEYYHMLYDHRSQHEADTFAHKFVHHNKPKQGQVKWLDLACGKGRFSIALSKYDADIVGLDLSANSIAHNTDLDIERADFRVHDMRHSLPLSPYDIVFNMFTSFGYFENPDENTTVIRQIHRGLNTGGLFVMDYMHCEHIVQYLKPSEHLTKFGVQFDIKRTISRGMIRKTIVVEDQANDIHFEVEETVRFYSVQELIRLVEGVGFKLEQQWGDYDLSDFGEESPRNIMVFKKI